MSTTQTELAAGAAHPPLLLSSRDRWIDLCFVLGIALWRPILMSTVFLLHIRDPQSPNSLRIVYSLLYEASGLAALAWVLWKRNAGMAALTKRPKGGDLPTGAALCILTLLVSGLAGILLYYAWSWATGHPPVEVHVPETVGMQPNAGWVIFLLFNPWAEELVVRGFLMTEVTALAGVRTAVVVSTLVQVSYHLYQGWLNAAGIAVVFLGYSLYFARTRRLLPIVVAHTLMDFMSFGFFVHQLR